MLRSAIIEKSGIGAEAIDLLRVFKKSGTYAGRKVTHLRVYNPALTEVGLGAVTKYGHLDTQPQAICFAGHMESGGGYYIRDARELST